MTPVGVFTVSLMLRLVLCSSRNILWYFISLRSFCFRFGVKPSLQIHFLFKLQNHYGLATLYTFKMANFVFVLKKANSSQEVGKPWCWLL